MPWKSAKLFVFFLAFSVINVCHQVINTYC